MPKLGVVPPPPPPLESPAQSQVEEWLSRQIIREEQAPVVDFPTTDLLPSEPEDDYRPESFLLDEWDEFPGSLPPPDNDSFAVLTEPVPQLEQEMESEIQADEPPQQPALPTPAFLPELVQESPPPSFEWPPPASPPPPPPPPVVVADSAWTLGVDPMPSLNEAAPTPYVAPAGSLFFSPHEPPPVPFSTQQPPRSDVFSTAPVRQEEIGPPLFFATEVFQGASFPDEIQVPPAAAEEPLSRETPPPAPVPPPVTEESALQSIPPPPAPSEPAAPEIQVELASPGEASFDSPLEVAPPNPWQPQPEEMASPPAPQLPPQIAGALVEAEIVLRPRAPMQNAVVSKSKFAPPSDEAADAHFPGPLQSKDEPKPRPTWRSWWRGD
ncbi:MAG: hypothetical protein J0L73_13470 [Verrucomicrobia bacterium]|nr:hypothetical protein [Verrucomicrobiota bacterium]